MPVAEGVTAFNLDYWSTESKEWKSDWNSASGDHPNKLPGAVRINLKLADPDNPERIITYQGVALVALAPGPDDF